MIELIEWLNYGNNINSFLEFVENQGMELMADERKVSPRQAKEIAQHDPEIVYAVE